MTIDALHGWLSSSGAVDGGRTAYSLVLQGAEGKNVLVTGVDAVLERRVAASANENSIYVDSNGCGGELGRYFVTIDLDQPNPVPNIAEQVNGNPVHVNDFKYIAANDGPVSVEISAMTRKSDVTWHLRIDYTVDGKLNSWLIPRRGMSFHTVAPLGAKKSTYRYNLNNQVYSLEAGCPSGTNC
jgi:hypothetical protein